MAQKTMPIQAGDKIDLAERRGERPVLVRSIPWEMIGDEACERQCQENHGQSLECIRDRCGFGANEVIAVMAGLEYKSVESITERDAHRILYSMVVLFNRGQRVAEARSTEK